MADMFDDVITGPLDQLVPVRQFVRRPRPSDPWFDRECRDAKRLTRRLRRIHVAALRNSTSLCCSYTASPADVSSMKSSAAESAWREQRRRYRELLDRKRSSYWQDRIKADQASPKRLWKAIDALLGRGHQPVNSTISVDDFSDFFFIVDAVRRSTEGSPDPVYSDVHQGCLFDKFASIGSDDVIASVRRLPTNSHSVTFFQFLC
jgi:hypothetical protein